MFNSVDFKLGTLIHFNDFDCFGSPWVKVRGERLEILEFGSCLRINMLFQIKVTKLFVITEMLAWPNLFAQNDRRQRFRQLSKTIIIDDKRKTEALSTFLLLLINLNDENMQQIWSLQNIFLGRSERGEGFSPFEVQQLDMFVFIHCSISFRF